MKVTFKHWGAELASSRYRAIIPAQQLMRMGHGTGSDWLVIGKHGWSWVRETAGFSRVCFDVCDDHFSGPFGDHYHNACRKADLVTCNSAEMARVIEQQTGRKAAVIPDPYEQPEKPARIGERVLWFGHQSNLGDLMPWMEGIDSLEIVTGPNIPGTVRWTPESMDQAFNRAGLVIIPTGKSMAKSSNRAIESIRRGLFVVAGYLPAYADLGIYIGNIHDGIAWALANQDEALSRIKRSQDYIRTAYSPERIGELWLQALK